MTYCNQPFTNIRIEPDRNGDMLYRPCCLYQPELESRDLKSYIDSIELTELRLSLLDQTQLPASCGACSKVEQQGHRSLRQIHNQDKPVLTSVELTSVEVFPGNICNLRCLMCEPQLSSALAAEYQRVGWHSGNTVIEHTNTIQDLESLTNLKSVTFIGGEFFLAKNSLEILDYAINKNLNVSVITNGTVLSAAHLARLKQVGNLDLTISIDGVGSVNEFIRYPSAWHEVNTNVDQLIHKLPAANVHFNTVVQLFNAHNLGEILAWVRSKNKSVQLTPLEQPRWLGWSVLTGAECEKLAQQIESIADIQLDAFVKNLRQAEFCRNTRKQFVEKVSTLCRSRKIDLQQVNTVLDLLPLLKQQVISSL
jgi:sulfatase maturation enzyme AslB (radical SAM superfamily)